jgi:class 3 adenylate cyclase
MTDNFGDGRKPPVPRYHYTCDPEHGILVRVDPESLAAFGPDLLKLGDVRTPSRPVDVLAVIFDLEGFTHFTRQIDPQLTVPTFLSAFLQWLFQSVKAQLVQKESSSTLWAELPFFSKFMGDGVLFLWRIDLDQIVGMDRRLPSDRLQASVQEFLCNIIASMLEVGRDYAGFLQGVGAHFVDPPRRLRCGIARGTVIPVGQGADFVGPCINIAARLQKLHNLSFSCSARGIDRDGFNPHYGREFLKLRTEIRGIGDQELVYVLLREWEALPESDRAAFREP